MDNADANYYAYPLDICAEVSEKLKVTKIYQLPKIYHLPSGPNDRIHDKPKPFDRRKIHSAETGYSPGLRPSVQIATRDGIDTTNVDATRSPELFARHLTRVLAFDSPVPSPRIR